MAEDPGLLGRYENFPEIRHGIVRFLHNIQTRELQRSIIKALHELTLRRRSFKLSSVPSVSNCKVLFDFGIADSLTFNYLDEEVMKLSLEAVSREALSTLDFICIVRYYRRISTRRYKPLRFDYYIIRFGFYDGRGDIQVYHEKGTRRLPIDDLITLIIRRVNRELVGSKHPKITVEHKRTL